MPESWSRHELKLIVITSFSNYSLHSMYGRSIDSQQWTALKSAVHSLSSEADRIVFDGKDGDHLENSRRDEVKAETPNGESSIDSKAI